MIWAVSNNCWISTFPGRHNEQSHNAFYTAKTCRISYKHQEHYETDDGRCSEQFLKTRIFLWPTVHQLCYALNKYYGLSCLEATIFLRFSYGLSCLEQLLKMDFSRDPQRTKSACIVHTSNLQNTPRALYDNIQATYIRATYAESIIKPMALVVSRNVSNMHFFKDPQCRNLAMQCTGFYRAEYPTDTKSLWKPMI